MINIPPYLNKGDTIGIVSPAGFMPFEKMQHCIDALKRWGYNVKLGNTAKSSSSNYFSGTDAERLTDLQQLLDDDDVQAVLCARGGYGLTRIVDRINFKKFETKPKWVIGFSDVTVLLNHIYSNCNVATMHAPMAGAFNNADTKSKYLLSLKKALEGKKIMYTSDFHPYNRKGEAVGELVGGNLALVAHGIGTDSDIKTRGKILFLEDVGEYLYNIDRMMQQLKRSGKLKKLGGLIVGQFNDIKDTDRPFGQAAEDIIRDAVNDYDFPVCFGFPVGHGKENLALKVGVGYKLRVARSKVILEE